MVFQRLVLSLSSKQKLIKQLEEKYGEDFKTPLANDLGVNISTIRRLFNQRDEIPLVYVYAIEALIGSNSPV